MSKSDENQKAYISMLDDDKTITKKIKSAVTDSDQTIRFDRENKPGVANLMSIMSLASGKDLDTIEKDYSGSGYGAFKEDTAEAVVQLLRPIRERHHELMESDELDRILDEGADRAQRASFKTLKKAERALGLGRKR